MVINQNNRIIIPISYGIIGIVLLVVYLPNFWPTPERDSGVFLYMAQRILDGALPYSDLWDHKPPMIYLVNVLGLYLGSGSVIGVRALEFICLYAAALFGFASLRIAFGVIPALTATFFWIISLLDVLQGGNFTEEYALFCQFATMFLFIHAEKEDQYLRKGLLIGLLGGIAFFLRQNLIGLWIALGLFFSCQAISSKNPYILTRKLCPILFGSVVTILVVVGFFVFNDALSHFWDGAFLYNFSYSSAGSSLLLKLKVVYSGMSKLWLITPIIIIGYLMTSYFLSKRQYEGNFQKSILVLALIWYPLELLLSTTSGKRYEHYFIAYLPVFSILSCFFVYAVLRFATLEVVVSKKISITLGQLSIICVLLLVVSLKANNILSNYDRKIISKNKHPMEKIAEYIKKTTKKDDLILVWGADPTIYFLSKRHSPTRYFYQYPLITTNYSNPLMINEFVREVINKKPHFIIDSRNKRFPPLSEEEREKWQLSELDKLTYFPLNGPQIQRLYTFITENYEKDRKVEKWVIYKIRQ